MILATLWILVSFGDAWRCRNKFMGVRLKGIGDYACWFVLHIAWTPIKIIEYFIKKFVSFVDRIRRNQNV